MHGGGGHGVEREDEFLSVAHARRLGVIPRDALKLGGVVAVLMQVGLIEGMRGKAGGQRVGRGVARRQRLLLDVGSSRV